MFRLRPHTFWVSGRWYAVATLIAVVLVPSLIRAAETDSSNYSPEVSYARGRLVVGSDGNVYRAVDPVKGKDPVTAVDAVWQLANAAFDMTLDVPGRFKTIEKAIAFIEGSTISGRTMVTLQLAPGRYDLIEPLAIGHANGRRLVLNGGKDPSKYVLTCGNHDGIVVDEGNAITIEGLTLEGASPNHHGITVENGSTAVIKRVVVEGFKIGVSAENDSHVFGESVEVKSRNGDAGFYASSGSTCSLKECSATLEANPRSSELSMGFASWLTSSMECLGCTSSGWHDGFFAGNAASIDLKDCMASNNVFGGAVYLGGAMRAAECTFEKNRDFGLTTHNGTVALIACRFRDNKLIALRSYGGSMVDLRGPHCEISGSQLGLQSIAGGIFVGVRPVIRGDGRLSEIYQYKTAEDAVFQFEK